MAKINSHVIAPQVEYLCHPHHRNNNRKKSQWRITEPQEVACFQLTHTQQWIVAAVGWGLHVVNNAASFLGVAQDRQLQLFIAKFVSAANSGGTQWHGYPADHRASEDRPPDDVLGAWLAGGRLPAAKLRKVQKGEPCNL